MEIKEAFIEFIKENNLSPFNRTKTSIKPRESIFKTRDAKKIHNKVLSKISQEFVFPETANLFNALPFTTDAQEIQKRQEFFKSIQESSKTILQNLKTPRPFWKPKYDLIAVTENEQTYLRLNELGCATQLLVSQNDVAELERYDLVQVIDCDAFQTILERLPQAIFINEIEDVYLERYLEKLSAWKENLEIIDENFGEEINQIKKEISPSLDLINNKAKIVTREEVDLVLEKINEKVSEKIKQTTISGDSLLKILGEGKIPQNLYSLIEETIKAHDLPQHIFDIKIPVAIDEKELEELIKRQSTNEFTNLSAVIKSQAKTLKQIPTKLEKLKSLLLLEDFKQGISKYKNQNPTFPQVSEEVYISEASNLFLENAQKISFYLNQNEKCSILTGANSGGKTTLLEHLIQVISLLQLGLPVNGNAKMPLFTDVYYFAKTKGSVSKGAFETLLTQMSKIKPGNKTIILADEIEAVTEPGVAGEIISATSNYFLKKECFLVIATHLGHEIQKTLPSLARIDGIEAKGLTKDFELIVDHNPVLGRLAHSTPELIVEKMANSNQLDYFKYLNEFLKNKVQ